MSSQDMGGDERNGFWGSTVMISLPKKRSENDLQPLRVIDYTTSGFECPPDWRGLLVL
jgi:hypothetical protein